MKEIIKKISINLFILILVCTLVDYILYKKFYFSYYKNFDKESSSSFPFPKYNENYKAAFSGNSIQHFNKTKDVYFRLLDFNKNYKKNSILLFGGSYAYGTFLKHNQTLGYKLSELSQRNVFDFSIPGCGIQHMLYIINKNLYGKLDDTLNIYPQAKPEYAIFVYIPNHILRVQTNIFCGIRANGINLQYKLKNNDLTIKNYPNLFIYKTFLLKSIYYAIDKKNKLNSPNFEYNGFMLANEIFLESKKLLEEKFPNIKFIIFNYQTEDDENEYELPFMWEVLKKEGFIIVNSEDLIKKKFQYHSQYTEEDGYHPNEAAWDILVPELIKKLNL